jgi:uridine kinase
MSIRPPEYDRAVQELTPLLRDFPGKIVGIDGRDGSGKTTLGRFLAWYFDVTLIETDPFREEGRQVVYRAGDIDRVITHRLSRPRPVIVEGFELLRLFRELNRSPDFLIYVRNTRLEGIHAPAGATSQYEVEFGPEKRANLVVDLSRK